MESVEYLANMTESTVMSAALAKISAGYRGLEGVNGDMVREGRWVPLHCNDA